MRVVGVEWNTHPRSRTINAQSWCDLNQLQKTRFGENVAGGRFLCPKLNNLWEKQLWEAKVIKEALLHASINHFTFRAKKGFGRSTHANGTIAQCTHVKTFFGARHCWIVFKVTKYHRLGFSRIFGFVGFSPFSNLFLINLTISQPSRFRCNLCSMFWLSKFSFGLFQSPASKLSDSPHFLWTVPVTSIKWERRWCADKDNALDIISHF